MRRLGLAAALALWSAAADAQQDPRLQWQTLQTPHFNIHFYQDMEPVARRVAEISEGVAARLSGPLGWTPSARTEIVLSDVSDDANGSATAIPFNTVRLFLTAPDDLSPLSQHEDWLTTLIIHEYTHVLHTDNVSGLPAIVNALLGKQWAPNHIQARFILEGIATYEESLRTRGGRLRSSIWDMQLRADALEGRLVSLDQLASGPNRWPHGNIWYLYGSYLMQYVAERFGHEVLARLSAEYGSMAAPWQLNRAVARVTGRTWEALYEDFLDAMRARYAQQRRVIESQGVIEGARLTAQGESVRAPRFLQDGTLLYESSDGQSQPMIRAISPEFFRAWDHRAPARPEVNELEWQASPSGFAAISRDALVVSDIAAHRDIYLFHDLYRWTLQRDARGRVSVDRSERLTDGWRAQQPDASPDGDHVAFATTHRGTSSLVEMSLADRTPHVIFRPRRFEQVYAPRYSPDGRAIAFSHWRTGGRRDIAVLQRDTGAITHLTDDRALDTSPVFSPDGRYLLWTSDRTGVMNIYARDLRENRTLQVTHSVMGAFQPTISPDGRTLAYAGYSSLGYDLHAMPFDPAAWREPVALSEDPFGREGAPSDAAVAPFASSVSPYNPWPTLRPRNVQFDFGGDGFGAQAGVLVNGADVVGRHAWSARLGVSLERGHPNVDLSYVYRGLRPTLRLRAYRVVEPGTGYRVGRFTPVWAQERWGGESAVSVNFPGPFEQHSLSLGYEAQWIRPLDDFPAFDRFADPNESAPTRPFEGWVTGLRATWLYSRTQRYAYSISSQTGYAMLASLRFSDAMLGSSSGGVEATAGFTGYIPMPWGANRQRHVLAVNVSGGVATGDRAERGAFALGGWPSFSAESFLEAIRTGAQFGGVALRGYPPRARGGSQYQLMNLEYRFPIAQVQRGVSTIPIFVQRIYGGVFADAGHATFGRFNPDLIAVGAGAEVFVDLLLGFFIPFTVRVGYAHGFMRNGEDQFYGILSSPF